MEIRTLVPSDADMYLSIRLVVLQKNSEAFATSYEEEMKRPADKYHFQSEDSFTLGAFENGELIGVVTLVKEKLKKLRHKAHIVAMYVSPEKQGFGIGKALLHEVIKKAKDIQDIEQLNLSVVSKLIIERKSYIHL
jgi:GNAT superfamily N-acetyltransferase